MLLAAKSTKRKGNEKMGRKKQQKEKPLLSGLITGGADCDCPRDNWWNFVHKWDCQPRYHDFDACLCEQCQEVRGQEERRRSETA